MSLATLMFRLGADVVGTNADLVVLPKEQKEKEEDGGSQDDSDESDEEEENEEDDDSEGSGGDSEDGEEEEDESEDGDDSSEPEDGEDGDESDGSSGDGDPEDSDESDDGDEGDGDSPGSGGGSPDDDSDDDGEEEEYEDDAPQETNPGDEEEGENEGGGDSAGGQGGSPEEDDPHAVAESLLSAMESGEESGALDNNEALTNAVGQEIQEDVLAGEQIWHPYSTEWDHLFVPGTSEERKRAADGYKNRVKGEIAALRSKLRNKFLQARAVQNIHGVRKGVTLSERRLVDSVVELRAGRRPTRPDWDRVAKEECSLAVGVVVDESGSMDGELLRSAAMGALAIAEALSTLGSPCLVCGPRNAGAKYETVPYHLQPQVTSVPIPGAQPDRYGNIPSRQLYHRTDSVVIDLFKDWTEPMTTALPRFGALQAVGSTPLGDGIQFALQELNDRPERHRVIFVITDGSPDNSMVVKWQIRKAKEAGIEIVGIGIGYGAEYVKHLFPTHVFTMDLPGLPNKLLSVLENIMFPSKTRKVDFEGAGRMKATAKK